MKRFTLLPIGLLLLLLSGTASIADEMPLDPWEERIFETYSYLWKMAAIDNSVLQMLKPPKFRKVDGPAYLVVIIVDIKSRSDCEKYRLYWTEERRKAVADICNESISGMWREIESTRRRRQLEPAGYMLTIIGGYIGSDWSEMRYIESKDIKIEADEPQTPSKPDSWT